MELNLLNFSARFPDEQACYAFIAKRRWPDGLACLYCGSITVYSSKTRRMYKCKDCRRQFSSITGTIFTDTHLSLRAWFMAIYLLTTDGVSTNKLAELLGITQKTAWFLTQKVLKAMEDKDVVLSGVVQIDETYWGPKARGRSSARYSKKYAIMGAVEARLGGKMVAMVVKQPDTTVATSFIERFIKPGSTIHTDESRIYHGLRHRYEHATVNHSKRQYVYGGVTSNKIENGWMHTKRNLKGRRIHISGKHLSSYVDEFIFKYNARDVGANERVDKWLTQAWGKVLTYKQLLAKRAVEPMSLRGWARKQAAMPVQLRLL